MTNPLLPAHLADLRRSGLSDEQIKLCGFRSLEGNYDIAEALHWGSYAGELGPCLLIPFHDANGNRLDYCRLKPERPRDKNGKLIRYESPYKVPNRAYFPPHTRMVLNEQDIALLITEGEKKAAKADQEGFPTIGLVGVYGWQVRMEKDAAGNSTGERKLLEDLAALPLKGRTFFIVYDSDAADNPDVLRAERHLAETLIRHGAIVRIVRLPPPKPASAGDKAPVGKQGLDDFLLAHGADALKKLLLESKALNQPEQQGQQALKADDDPERLAILFLEQCCAHPEALTLKRWHDEWHRWTGRCWQSLEDEEFTAEVWREVQAEMNRRNIIELRDSKDKDKLPFAKKVTRSLVSNVTGSIASMTMCRSNIEPPMWWDGREWRPRSLIAVSNGLLDIDAVFSGKVAPLRKHTPRWFSPVCLPFPWDVDADCPRWKAFLAKNLEGDQERINLLQEWFGYCLTPDTSRQKFLVLEGEGGNGKSVICAALKAVLGKENCSHVTLELFGEPFQLISTLGKLANIASEVGDLDKAAEGVLKSFTGGDEMKFDRKFKSSIETHPTARLVLATNTRPRFKDRSSGIWRRMILMPLRVTIADGDPHRVHGMDSPDWWLKAGELPGMLCWALVGLQRLRQQKRFTSSTLCNGALNDYRDENDPARLFLSEHCTEDAESEVYCSELYQAYAGWCKQNGYAAINDSNFAKAVYRSFPKSKRQRLRIDGGRIQAYKGFIFTKPM